MGNAVQHLFFSDPDGNRIELMQGWADQFGE